MYTKIGDTAIKLIAKVGTQSFSDVSENWYGSNEQALLFPTRVMFVREPMERLKSCYQFFVGLRDAGTTYSGFSFDILDTWQTFIDYILLGNVDEHWQTQSEQATSDGELTPTEYLKFDDLGSWFPVFFNIRLPHINSSEPLVVDDTYRSDELGIYYADDYDLYNTAKSYGGEQWPLPQ